jgi:NHL repeat
MTAGNIYTIAGHIVGRSGAFAVSGEGGPATRAMLDHPNSVTVDPAGDEFISAFSEYVRVVPASTGTLFGRQMTAGHIYNVAGTGVPGFSGDGGPGGRAKVDSPTGMAVDGAGNLLIADYYNLRIRVVAAHTGSYYGQPMTAGDIYTVAGDGTAGFSGDGGPATAAELNHPNDVVLDGAGNLLITDTLNDRVRVVAESTGSFCGQAMTAGDIYTVAGDGTAGFSGDGGPATAAELDGPDGMTVDRAGNLLFADEGNNRVRVVAARTGGFYGQAMTTGNIYTVAGNGTTGYTGDGGPPTAAGMQPDSVAVDAAGNLVISDGGNNAIRVVAARTGTFYGRAMTGGNIYTVAGNGTSGYSGDGGPAIVAELADPVGVALTPGGNLLFADNEGDRVREVTGP